MNSEIIPDILNSFMPFSVTFAIILYLCEFIFKFIIRLAFGRVDSRNNYL